jgi:putative hydrolase of the HAD superfamily
VIRVVLFDVGGVLVELTGVPTMLRWLGDGITREELWRLWLVSPSVRAYETGRISTEVFAAELISEMGLPIDSGQLIEEFSLWPRNLYPGTLDVLSRIPRRFVRATLSNSNALHWPRIIQDFGLAELFDHHFASHLTGRIKPDEEAFTQVTVSLQCRPNEVLFLDDNLMNVETAARVGMNSARVEGLAAAERVLVDAGVLNG